VLSKIDGDARGGAALSVVSVVGVPIAFVGSGERLEDLEPFHADRFVSRMLGMGDVLSLIEKAEEAIDAKDAERLEEKIRKGGFTLEDFRDQLRRSRRWARSSTSSGCCPAWEPEAAGRAQAGRAAAAAHRGDHQLDDARGTRKHAEIIDGSRRKRIAKGSGTAVEDVNRLLKQFVEMQRMLKMVGQMTGEAHRGAAPARRRRRARSV
jgi:signal recognition particle subunit SRP54